MDMDEIKVENTDLLAGDQEQKLYKHEQPSKNRNLFTALIIGGVALGFIALLVVILMSTGWFKNTSTINAYHYAPAKNASIATFDLGMNMGDVVSSVSKYMNMIDQQRSKETMAVLEQLPDLGFLDVKGFVLLNQSDNSDVVIGLGYSGRNDPQKAVTGMLEKLSSNGLVSYQKDDEGFIDIMQNGKTDASLYLDDSYLLLSSGKQNLKKCLSNGKSSTDSLTSHPKWQKIKGLVDGSPISYCGIFDYLGREIVLVGSAQNLSNEVSFKLSWLDGVEQVETLIGDELPMDFAIKDFFKWQKNLSQTISETPDGTMRFALPFAISDLKFPKPVEGEISGFVDFDDMPYNQTIGLKMKAGKQEIENILSQLVPPGSKTTPQADGSVMVDFGKPRNLEIPKSPNETNPKSPTDTPSKEYEQPNPASEIFGTSNNKMYYKKVGDSLILGSASNATKWVAGRKEQVQGNIMALVFDGKKMIDNLLPLLSLYSGNLEGLPGMSGPELAEILKKLDVRMNIDILTKDKDLSVVLSIKYNLEKAFR